MKKYGVLIVVAAISIGLGFLISSAVSREETDRLKASMKAEFDQKAKKMEADYTVQLQEAEARIRLAQKATSKARKVAGETRKGYLYEQARLLIKAQEFEEAARTLQEILVFNVNDKDIYYDLAVIYDEHLNEPGQAVGYYGRYLEMIPKDDPMRSKIQMWRTKCLRRAVK